MIDVTTGVSFGGLALAIAGFAWLWNRLATTIAAERAERERLERDFAKYQREAMASFVSSTSFEKMEDRLVLIVEKLAARVETVVARMEAMTVEMARQQSAGRSERARKPALIRGTE